jgi:hypothetical protein
MLTACDHSRLDALTTVTGDTFDVEDREQHTAYCTGTMRQGQEFLKQGAPAPFKPTCTCDDGKLPGGEYCNCKTGSLRRELDTWANAGFKRPHQQRGKMAAAGR